MKDRIVRINIDNFKRGIVMDTWLVKELLY